MNIKQLLIIMACLGLTSNVSVYCAVFKDKNAVIRDIQTTVNLVFHSSTNMLEQRLDFKPLDTFLTNLDPYINEKISVPVIGKDKEISASYTLIKSNINNFINAVKIFYNSYMLNPNKSANDKKNMAVLAKRFEEIANIFKKEQENLKKIRSKTVLGNKKDAIDVLTLLAQQFEVTGMDAALDYQTIQLENLD